jgi:hypothetical protein
MKVKDLILRLQECNPDNVVIVDGYEGGVTELVNITDNVMIALDVNHESYYGEHEIVTPMRQAYPNAEHTMATYLPRCRC